MNETTRPTDYDETQYVTTSAGITMRLPEIDAAPAEDARGVYAPDDADDTQPFGPTYF